MRTETSASIAEALVASGTTPTQAAARREREACVARALAGLSAADREALVLRHFEGLTSAEAARELGIGEEAASKRYVRALERMRDVLAAQGDRLA
jgi:RNA polymerase sigma-70 factor (ECF subfamily)